MSFLKGKRLDNFKNRKYCIVVSSSYKNTLEFKMESLNFQLFFYHQLYNIEQTPHLPLSFSLSLAFTPIHELHSSPRITMLTLPLICSNCLEVALREEQYHRTASHLLCQVQGWQTLAHLML